jgi:hypothetical protein
MDRSRLFPIVLAVASLAIACASLQSQTVQDLSADHLKMSLVPEDARPMPFPPGSEAKGWVEFRSAGQMTREDRDLAADAESSIGERAGFAGLEFNAGPWSYRQMVCPALPNHLFLRFTRNNGAGDASVFSASIPRNGEGHVRIIPILRRSYSLFSPAPINAVTVSAFNHIRAEEHPGKAPDWLGTALCYAALAGAQPQAERSEAIPEVWKFPTAVPAVLQIPVRGGAILQFAEGTATAKPVQWTMTFSPSGRLLKATHTPAPPFKVTVIPERAGLQSAPWPSTLDVTSHALEQSAGTAHPVPSN